MKFLLFSATALFAIIQPVISTFYASKSADKQRDFEQINRAQTANENTMKMAVSQMLEFSEKLGILKTENENLKKRIFELEAVQNKLESEKNELAEEIKLLKNP